MKRGIHFGREEKVDILTSEMVSGIDDFWA